jgi:hypothetical protein
MERGKILLLIGWNVSEPRGSARGLGIFGFYSRASHCASAIWGSVILGR